MTRATDLDSLNADFLRGLHRLLDIKATSLFSLARADDADSISQTLRSERTQETVSLIWPWMKHTSSEDLSEDITRCIVDAQEIESATADSTRSMLPIVSRGKVRGVLSVDMADSAREWWPSLRALTEVYANFAVVLDASERDKLTGLLNRRTFDEKLRRMLQRQSRLAASASVSSGREERRRIVEGDGHPAWLAVADIDHFKRINDEWGHIYGDELLLRLAQRMRQLFRAEDLLFRVGGEEFVVVLCAQSKDSARQCLERLRQTVAEDRALLEGVTISIGFAAIGKDDYPPHVFDRADKALYQAKENGRDQTINYEDLADAGVLEPVTPSGSIELF